jgi:hypothetical protein
MFPQLEDHESRTPIAVFPSLITLFMDGSPGKGKSFLEETPLVVFLEDGGVRNPQGARQGDEQWERRNPPPTPRGGQISPSWKREGEKNEKEV